MENKTRNVLIIIAVLILLGIIGFATKRASRSVLNNALNDERIVSAIESRLKTYSNEKFGVDVHYPYDVFIEDSTITENSFYLSLESLKQDDEWLSIGIFYNNTHPTPEDVNVYVKQSYEPAFKLTVLNPISKCVLNGEQGCSSDYSYEFVDKETGLRDNGYLRIITIVKNNNKCIAVIKNVDEQSKLDSSFQKVVENLEFH